MVVASLRCQVGKAAQWGSAQHRLAVVAVGVPCLVGRAGLLGSGQCHLAVVASWPRLVVAKVRRARGGRVHLGCLGLVEGWGVSLCLAGMVVVSRGPRLRPQFAPGSVQRCQVR